MVLKKNTFTFLYKVYALKCLQKAQVVAYKQEVNIMNEKNLLMEAVHPFILQLITTYKDR